MRVLGWIFGIIIIIGLAGYAAFHYLGPRFVAHIAGTILDTEVTLQGVSINQGMLRLHAMEVRNPDGFPDAYALTSQSVRVTLPKKEDSSAAAVIEGVFVRNAHIYIDERPSPQQNNWALLIQNAKKSAAESSGKPGTLRIDRILLENATIHIRSATGEESILPAIERLEPASISVTLENINIAQIVAHVMSQILDESLAAIPAPEPPVEADETALETKELK